SLAADVPNDSSMRSEIAERVAQAARSAGLPVPALPKGTTPEAAAANPDDAAMAAAAQMPEAQRKQFIQSMVAKLAAQMQSKPNDLGGWMRLGRAYAVLGDKAKAVDAYQRAAALKPDDVTIKLREIEVLVTGLQPNDPLPKQVVGLLHEIQKVAPDQPEALWYLGVIAAREGHPLEARDDWNRLLKQLSPGSEDAKMVKAALDQVKLK
ncbi:MAG TPA: tetratricopeptide repeat protein, partial [Acetobacteraceae bacterium]|nr:tetratricopeptide repeat protein [Acetobacteraceae bacterium]